jgi:AraC-like DNA-binding protein
MLMVREAREFDVLASVLDVHRFKTAVAGRIDLSPPWRLNGTPTNLLAIHVQVTGHSFVVSEAGTETLVLEPGDVAIYPHGIGGGYLHDGSNPARETATLAIPLPDANATPAPLRLTGGSADSSIICCLMQVGPAPKGPLWDGLPSLIHVRARALDEASQLSRVAELMIMESAAPGDASKRLMSRLAELLLILALRMQASGGSTYPGLRALADPHLARALKLIHANPSEHLSVARLAAECGLSRSAFAVHFAKTVGQTPLNYAIGWRMAVAVQLLETTDLTIDRIAASVGYRSEASFRRAFVGVLGCAPREYRTRERVAAA